MCVRVCTYLCLCVFVFVCESVRACACEVLEVAPTSGDGISSYTRIGENRAMDVADEPAARNGAAV